MTIVTINLSWRPFDELEAPSSTSQILEEENDIQMPDFVKKLIAKKGREKCQNALFD